MRQRRQQRIRRVLRSSLIALAVLASPSNGFAFGGNPLRLHCRVSASARKSLPHAGLTMFGDGDMETKGRVEIVSKPPPLRREKPDDSPYGCEVDYNDDTATRGAGARRLCWDAEVTPQLARAIIEEAVANMTVPAQVLTEALNRLRYSSEDQLRSGSAAGAAAAADVRSLSGFWALRYRSGGVVAEADANGHGYLTGGDRVDLRLNFGEGGVSLDTNRGLVAKTLSGGFTCSPAGDALEARFSEARVGPFVVKDAAAALAYDLCRLPLRLRVFLATEGVLGVVATFAGRSGVLLFQRDAARSAETSRVQANAIKHAKSIMNLAKFDAVRQNNKKSGGTRSGSDEISPAEAAAAGSGVAGGAVAPPLAEPEKSEAERAAEYEAAWQKVYKRQSFLEYAEEEALKLYAVVAGPTLFGFLKLYVVPISIWKAAAAAAILQQVFESNV